MGSGLRRNDGARRRNDEGGRHTGAGRYPRGQGWVPASAGTTGSETPERRGGPSGIPAARGETERRGGVSRGAGDGFRPPPERRAGTPERRLPKPVRKGRGNGDGRPRRRCVGERRAPPPLLPSPWRSAKLRPTSAREGRSTAERAESAGGRGDGFRPPPERRGGGTGMGAHGAGE